MDDKVSKVLIYTQARSGSTFLLALMSAGPHVASFSEPFFGIMRKNTVSDNAKGRLLDLFECKEDAIVAWNEGHKHARIEDCGDTDGRIIKTIRLRYQHIYTWIQQTDIKVIHLVRDPRGIINSRLEKGWTHNNSPKKKCKQMEDDLELANILPSDRYVRVKYEEFIQDPFQSLQMLYEFSGLEITPRVYQFLSENTHGKGNGSVIDRDQDFDPNHWKTESSIEDIRSIEKYCQHLMEILNYPLYDPL